MNILYIDSSGQRIDTTCNRWGSNAVIWPATSFEEAYRIATERPSMNCVVIGSDEHSLEFVRFMGLVTSLKHVAIISATGDLVLDRRMLTRGCRVAMPVEDVPSFVRQLAVVS